MTTFAELWAIPEDKVRRDLIDGVLTEWRPSPTLRHARAYMAVFSPLYEWAEGHGASMWPILTALYLDDLNVVQPDLMLLWRQGGWVGEEYIQGPVDLVVEIAEEQTRDHDLSAKRDLYERFGILEYVVMDLVEEATLVFRLEGERYGAPEVLRVGDMYVSSAAPGLQIPVAKPLQATSR